MIPQLQNAGDNRLADCAKAVHSVGVAGDAGQIAVAGAAAGTSVGSTMTSIPRREEAVQARRIRKYNLQVFIW